MHVPAEYLAYAGAAACTCRFYLEGTNTHTLTLCARDMIIRMAACRGSRSASAGVVNYISSKALISAPASGPNGVLAFRFLRRASFERPSRLGRKSNCGSEVGELA